MTEEERIAAIAELRRKLNSLERGFDTVEEMNEADAGDDVEASLNAS